MFGLLFGHIWGYIAGDWFWAEVLNFHWREDSLYYVWKINIKSTVTIKLFAKFKCGGLMITLSWTQPDWTFSQTPSNPARFSFQIASWIGVNASLHAWALEWLQLLLEFVSSYSYYGYQKVRKFIDNCVHQKVIDM